MNTGALAKKMVLAVSEIDAVDKRGKNTKQDYAYVKATDVAAEVRKVLVKHGIAFDYDVLSTERWDKPTNSGGMQFFIQIEVAVTFTDQDTGESRTVKTIGWGSDTGDKAPYKAMTGALKYALRMNFLIPDESDPENDHGKEVKPEVQRKSTPISYHQGPIEEDPIFDENGDVVDVKPAKVAPIRRVEKSPEKTPPADGAISEGKAKRFWAIALGAGKSKEDIQALLTSKGLSRIDDCPWKGTVYNELCEMAGQ